MVEHDLYALRGERFMVRTRRGSRRRQRPQRQEPPAMPDHVEGTGTPEDQWILTTAARHDGEFDAVAGLKADRNARGPRRLGGLDTRWRLDTTVPAPWRAGGRARRRRRPRSRHWAGGGGLEPPTS